MNVPIRLGASASRACQSCRRTFASTSQRRVDSLLELDAHITGRPVATSTSRPAPKPTAPVPTPSTSSSPQPGLLTKDIRRLLEQDQASSAARRAADPSQQIPAQNDLFAGALAGMTRQEASEAVERQQGRKWFTGDVYSLHDLGPREGMKWARLAGKPARDVFEMIGTDPRKHYKNVRLLADFVSETGRIKHNRLTGLKPKNQRKLAKAVRRAIGSGLMPSVHRHPEVISRSLGIEDHLKPKFR